MTVNNIPPTVALVIGWEFVVNILPIGELSVSATYLHKRAVPPVTLQVSSAVCPAHNGPGSVRILPTLSGDTSKTNNNSSIM